VSGGPTRASLSDQIVNLLVQLQQASSGGTQAASASSTAATGPVQQLFSAMDGDGDGTISQAETEKYIEGLGGSQQQADALYSSLSQDGSGGISESQLASAAAQGSQAVHHHHHGHGGEHGAPPAAPASASGSATQVFNALDTNKDGVVNSDELAVAFATNGSTAAGGVASSNTASDTANQLFGAMDSNSDGAVSKDEVQSFMTTLQQQVEADMKNMSTLMQMAVNSYDKAQGLGSNAQTSTAQSA